MNAGKAEIAKDGNTIIQKHDVAEFDVMMDHLFLMGVIQGIENPA